MNALVVGAGLRNKGAQSMLFITVDEIKKRFNNCTIYFASADSYDESQYAFKNLHYSDRGKIIALGGVSALVMLVFSLCKDFIKIILGKKDFLGHYFDVKNNMKKMDIMIDISGFGLGDKWSLQRNRSYLNNIRLAQKYHIPLYCMPQSFGPFSDSHRMRRITTDIMKLMPYPKVIYVRELQGYDLLCSKFSLTNVRLSADLVLQNKGINWCNILTKKPMISLPLVEKKNLVGIIPNSQCFSRGDKTKILDTYFEIISYMLDLGKVVYIMRHSQEDLGVCREISDIFREKKNFFLLENDFSCFEFDSFIPNFEYIVCSRFHGIVHAYKNGIPSIALGWANKYFDLAKCVDQEEFAFDITSSNFEPEIILNAVKYMSANFEKEQFKIKKNLIAIQKNNCFDILGELGQSDE